MSSWESEERTSLRRRRIDQMVRVARTYRGWSSGELSAALGRDRCRMAPSSGNPKLDLVARLADALDWEIGYVAESVWEVSPEDGDEVARYASRSFAELDFRAQTIHRASAYGELGTIARAMRRIARTPRERAVAANRLAGSYDGLGRFGRVLDCVREGLAERDIGFDLRLMLTVNLCGAYYALWNLDEAQSLAESLVARLDSAPCESRLRRVGRAFALNLRGQCARRVVAGLSDRDELRGIARAAEADLRRAHDEYAALHAEFGDMQYASLANTAEGAILEVRAASGDLDVDEAIQAALDRLEHAVDVETLDEPGLLESWGWWGVFGANIALRAAVECDDGLRTARLSPAGAGASVRAMAARGRASRSDALREDFERAIAIFTNKAAEIAEHLNIWPMRERAFTLEWMRRQTALGSSADEIRAWTLDDEDVRTLVGTMGRFPMFREVGWRILDTAMIAEAV